jgi:hypothetical protein
VRSIPKLRNGLICERKIQSGERDLDKIAAAQDPDQTMCLPPGTSKKIAFKLRKKYAGTNNCVEVEGDWFEELIDVTK